MLQRSLSTSVIISKVSACRPLHILHPHRFTPLFSQWASFFQLYLHYLNWNTMLWKIKIIFPNVFLLCLVVKLSQHYFISFVDQLVGTALHPSFYRVLAFPRWSFVLVENFQVKFCLIVPNHLKSILWNTTTKTIMYIVWCILWRFNFIRKGVWPYRFCSHRPQCTKFF